MNITVQDFRTYLEVFHSELEGTAKNFLSEDVRDKLFHLSFLPARIVGYVSTQFGVGFEYIPASTTTISVTLSSKRIEDMFFNSPIPINKLKTVFGMQAANNQIKGLTIENRFPLQLYDDASVSLLDFSFKIDYWERVVKYAELYGNRKRENWDKEHAISRAKDEVLAALVELRRASDRRVSLSEYISTYKHRTVLLLGGYDIEGMTRLDLIAAEVIKLGYHPLLIKDISDHPHHDLSQKVVVAGSISRFVIVDDSSRSGHFTEIELCQNNRWVTILLRAGGKGGSWMTAGKSLFSKVILEKEYDPSMLFQSIQEAVLWAEDTLESIEGALNKTYPWRGTN